MYKKKYSQHMDTKKITARFYSSPAGNEPVRDWIKGLDKDDRTRIGKDILTVERGWPIGMPTCRPLRDGINEVRTDLEGKRIARILFYVEKAFMYLLHGFIKKSQKTPQQDIDLAISRKGELLKKRTK